MNSGMPKKAEVLGFIADWKYQHSEARSKELLDKCDVHAKELIRTSRDGKWDQKQGNEAEMVRYAKALRAAVDKVRVILRTKNPQQAVGPMFDAAMLSQLLRIKEAPPKHLRTTPMTLTAAAVKLGYCKGSKRDASKGQKQVERDISAGLLRAERISPNGRKWWFDRTQVPE